MLGMNGSQCKFPEMTLIETGRTAKYEEEVEGSCVKFSPRAAYEKWYFTLLPTDEQPA